MIINKVSDSNRKDNPHGVDVRMLYNKDSAQAVHMQLMPGEGLKPHITPVDVFFYIIEGTPSVLVGEEKVQVEANSLVESPAGIVHSIYNESDKIARVLVVKAPKPQQKTKVL